MIRDRFWTMDEIQPAPWDSIQDASQEALTGTTDASVTPQTLPQSFQLGTVGQTVVVEAGKKGPKIPLILAAVFLAIGLLGFAVGGIAGAAMEETFEGLETGPYTSELRQGEALTHTDEDNAGEKGWYLLIPGDPKEDIDENGVPDACDNLGELSFTDSDGDDIGGRVATVDCTAMWDYYDIEDHVIVGVICNTLVEQEVETDSFNECEIGEEIFVSNANNVSMKVVDIDAMLIPVLGEIVGSAALMGTSFFAGCCSICGGLMALIIGLLRLGGGKPQTLHYQMN